MPKIVDRDARKVELAQAVWTVVARDGVEGASVRAVAAEAGWTRGVIAHYFKDHDDLLLFAYRLALQRESEFIPTPQEQPDPVERLIRTLLRTLPVDEAATLDFKIWLSFLGRIADNAELAQVILREHHAVFAVMRDLLADCHTAGLLDPPHGVQEASEAVRIFVDGLGVATALDPETYTRERMETMIRRFVDAWRPRSTVED
ncbi:TetR/AcrR family transcriptional regulator [Streptomyces sp. NPDC001663]|uniref:TetR/AcrR family transcriptional regulator n=2 Tax=Streptomyces sp. NPDC001663 TaxID=3364597 RepID=UPI0036C33EE8